jgi:hypothetical protein
VFDLWYEDALAPADDLADNFVKDYADRKATADRRALTAIIRADRPRWQRLPDTQDGPVKSPDVAYFLLVRLGFQFAVTDEGARAGTKIRTARCAAQLRAAQPEEPAPRVYDLAPRDLYDGNPRQVQLKVAPKISAGFVELSAETGHTITIGTVEPVVVGYPGAEEREPYWNLTPKGGNLIGVRHMWLTIEVLHGSTGIWLTTATGASVSTPWHTVVPLRSSRVEQSQYPAILISG